MEAAIPESEAMNPVLIIASNGKTHTRTETLIKLSHISRTKIYDTKFILNKEED